MMHPENTVTPWLLLPRVACRPRLKGEETRYAALFLFEQELRKRGYTLIAGVDEAGRGPLAGPVVAAAVILPETVNLPGLNDSKALDAAQRERLAAQIRASARAWAVGLASVEEIDALNILQASFLAMRRAIAGLDLQPDHVVVDGRPIPHLPLPQTGVIRGDAQVAAVAAASIIAKVTRDRIMVALDREFPQYGFARHKGYPTREHLAMIEKYGPSPYHRRSFGPVKNLLGERRSRD
uniref:Ribonuclease HII n=1 Tax=Ammonifex degensii TaxID=42838 RepID=A0A7C1FD02_9THEO